MTWPRVRLPYSGLYTHLPTPPVSGIESKFDVIIAHKVAKLHYHEWLRNDHFVSPDFVPISEDHWMAHVLRDLDEKSERKELVWVNRCRPEFPKDFADLARLHVPSLLYFFEKDARYWLAFLSHLEDDTPQYEW
jgi:pimeloyl-ACP methyl ester carboxylesterase